MKEAYIVIDIGTGNLRVAVTDREGTILGIGREDIHYQRDELYPDAIYFDPGVLWWQVLRLIRSALDQAPGVSIRAFTATSQREGIVLIGKNGKALIGLPNIDHRGREWENSIEDKGRVYQLTGRFPGSLFSALKLVGIRERRKEIWQELNFFVSISDWVEYELTGIAKYEQSQASETLLYDVEKNEWREELLNIFGIDRSCLPVLGKSGAIKGSLLPQVARLLHLTPDAIVVTGGGDTQLAIKSTGPSVEDVVIVSGTTTPVVKLTDTYITDKQQRTWTSRDIEEGRFVFEANAGVTGLNYQRLKEVFYPNEGYDIIEQELAANKSRKPMASLGSLIAGEEKALTSGGFIFPAPVTAELSRSCFVWATLIDIAFSIAENYQVLAAVAGHAPDYVWACGGGLQSPFLRQMIADCINKKVQVRRGSEQASVVGGALLCNEALGIRHNLLNDQEIFHPGDQEQIRNLYKRWKKTRNDFRSAC